MTTEQKALEMISAARKEHPTPDNYLIARTALCRAIEQHGAFRQEVSGAMKEYCKGHGIPNYDRFIIPAPKPDPLLAAMNEVIKTADVVQANADQLRAALDALGFEIREKNDD